MEDLLRPVTTVKIQARNVSSNQASVPPTARNIESLDDAIQILKDSPNATELSESIAFLRRETETAQDAKAAQAATVVVTNVLPDWWDNVKRDSGLESLRVELLDYLCSPRCLALIVSRLKVLTLEARDTSATSQPIVLLLLIDVLQRILDGSHVVQKLYHRCFVNSTRARQEASWKDSVSMLASGRLMSTVAEAEDIAKSQPTSRSITWISQGGKYQHWLGSNISSTILGKQSNDDREIPVSAAGTLLGKALMLGYQDDLVGSLLQNLCFQDPKCTPHLESLIRSLPAYQQRTMLVVILSHLNTLFSGRASTARHTLQNPSGTSVGDYASLIKAIIENNPNLQDYLSDLCVNVETSIMVRSNELRRLALIVFSDDQDRLSSMLERMLVKFGDQLFIRHASISQQEALAQLILLTAGYIHRSQAMLLFTIAKSSIQTHGTSNRLKASSQRAQWLGMIVAMALSQLTDKDGSRLVFDDESMRGDDAKWYQDLTNVDDKIGSIEKLKLDIKPVRQELAIRPVTKSSARKVESTQSRTKPKVTPVPSNAGPRIIEIDSDEDDGDDDLIPYAKPDSDPEDSDDDPTLINRNKPKPPVYIRDLLTGLHERENYDLHRLALETAASLVRRKATFGKEVSDHAEELLSILMNLDNTFDMDDFLDLRQEALIALLVAQPQIIAPAMAETVFQGNFSLQQRAVMLTALAMGARELAGFKDEDRVTTPSFPSKELPPHLRDIYSEGSQLRLQAASQRLEQAMVQPLALTAADQLSGPNALKVRTFSSRMEVEKKNKKKVKTNALAKNVADWFFLPLINGWWTQRQSLGTRAVSFSKHLLPLYLRTLAVLLHAAGPSTLSLPQLTTELWDVLLSLRINALHSNDVPTLDALLFAFLTLLELNEDKQRLANEHARELAETQEWAKLVLDQYGSEGGQENTEGGKVKMLAAAVVIKCHEVAERWQRLMMGDMVDF